MDVIEELNILKNDGYHNSFQNIDKQKKILEEKLYIIKAVNAINELENIINEGFFEKNGVDSIGLEVCYTGKHYYYFSMYKANKEINFRDDLDNDLEQIEKIRNAFNELNNLDLDNIGKIINEPIPLNHNNLRDNLLSMLLSKELKTVLDFSEMQCALANNEINRNPTNKL